MLQMCDVSKIPVSASRHEMFPSAVSAFTNFIVDAIYPGGKEAQYFGESWYTSFIKPASTTPVVRATIWAHDYRGILFSQPREQEGGQGFEVYVPIYRLSW